MRVFFMTKKRGKIRIAVFIDGANFEISLKRCGLWADYRKLIVEIEKEGKATILRYYSPTFKEKGQSRFFTAIKNLGFKIVTKNVKVIKKRKKKEGKANFDVEITFDAAVRIGQFDKLVLFSGDSDFVYLTSQLQKRGVKVMVISPLWRTAKELRKKADQFIDLRECKFVIKKLPFGSAHNNLSTAGEIVPKRKHYVKY